MQAGFELFQGGDPAVADAEVLSLITLALGDAPVDFVTGDMGLVLAAIDALSTSAARKAALRRHVWRPAKFHALLRRYGVEQSELAARRADLLAAEAAGRVPELAAAAGLTLGLRTVEDIAARAARLAMEAATPPLSGGEVDLLEAVLSVEDTGAGALARFRDLARDAPALAPAVDRFAARLDAWPNAAFRRKRCRSRRASGARRWNITTASCSGRWREIGRTCRRSPAADAMTR